jgi:alanine racemase
MRAIIDTHALRHNLTVIRARAPGARVMAVVKANAYGHGLISCAQALTGADAFAVARLEEGLALRAAGIEAPVVLLEGVFSCAQLGEALAQRLELVVHEFEQIELLEALRATQPLTLWIKIDTGMNRLGFAPAKLPAVLARLQALQPAPQLRLMTHLACADEPANPLTRRQLERFAQATHGLAWPVSIANSAALFGTTAVGGEWVRPGIALYGASPLTHASAQELNLRPVMTLTSSVIAVRQVARGESVGYGATWVAARDSSIAIIGAGYGDGVHRSLASGTPVLVAGARAALAGRVSMDMMAVDVTALPQVRVGAPVVLWGQGLPVEEVARHAGTISYELLCSVSRRVSLETR